MALLILLIVNSCVQFAICRIVSRGIVKSVIVSRVHCFRDASASESHLSPTGLIECIDFNELRLLNSLDYNLCDAVVLAEYIQSYCTTKSYVLWLKRMTHTSPR